MSTSSRVILFLAVALAVFVYLVSAAPVANNDLTAQLEFEAGSSPNINKFKKQQDDGESTTTSTETATSTKAHKHRKTAIATDYVTATSAKATTTTDEPTATPQNKKNTSSSSSGQFSGDGTYYAPGLGSCGWDNSDSDMIAALNHVQMANGANSNNNPNCGNQIKVTGPNGSVTLKIVDTCPGCSSGDIDMSPAAFSKIANLDAGRIAITWAFI